MPESSDPPTAQTRPPAKQARGISMEMAIRIAVPSYAGMIMVDIAVRARIWTFTFISWRIIPSAKPALFSSVSIEPFLYVL